MPVRLVVHGACLELPDAFVSEHPGGEKLLRQASLLADATPLFESYHAPTARGAGSIRTLARTFELDKDSLDPQALEALEAARKAPHYTYSSRGFYADVTQDVRAFFAARSGEGHGTKTSHKATTWWALKALALLAAWGWWARCACALSARTQASVGDDHISGSRFGAWLSGFVLGWLSIMLGFVVMHDASHYAVSSKPLVNEVLAAVVNLSYLWAPTVWLGHHVAGHHSFTGELKYDPDVVHGRPLVRKALADRSSAYLPRALALQRNTTSTGLGLVPWGAIAALGVFPGLFMGQGLTYVRAVLTHKKRYFGAALLPRGPLELTALAVAASVFCGLSFTKPLAVCGWLGGTNAAYFLCIAPDHDTFEAAVQDHDEPALSAFKAQTGLKPAFNSAAGERKAAGVPVWKNRKVEMVAVASSGEDDAVAVAVAIAVATGVAGGVSAKQLGTQPQPQPVVVATPSLQVAAEPRDWGALQARRSANFATDSPVVCCLFGGINYQVEHHLFPGVSHVWYPQLASLVKAACLRHGVPYHSTTWLEALASWCRAIHHAGGESGEAKGAKAA